MQRNDLANLTVQAVLLNGIDASVAPILDDPVPWPRFRVHAKVNDVVSLPHELVGERAQVVEIVEPDRERWLLSQCELLECLVMLVLHMRPELGEHVMPVDCRMPPHALMSRLEPKHVFGAFVPAQRGTVALPHRLVTLAEQHGLAVDDIFIRRHRLSEDAIAVDEQNQVAPVTVSVGPAYLHAMMQMRERLRFLPESNDGQVDAVLEVVHVRHELAHIAVRHGHHNAAEPGAELAN